MRISVLLSLVLAVLVVAGQANAKAVRTPISSGTAEGLCAGHGGGTECSYCKRGHCVSVSCLGRGCTQTVFTRAARTSGRGVHPSRGASLGNLPPKDRHSVIKATGFAPPSRVKTAGGEGHHNGHR